MQSVEVFVRGRLLLLIQIMKLALLTISLLCATLSSISAGSSSEASTAASSARITSIGANGAAQVTQVHTEAHTKILVVLSEQNDKIISNLGLLSEQNDKVISNLENLVAESEKQAKHNEVIVAALREQLTEQKTIGTISAIVLTILCLLIGWTVIIFIKLRNGALIDVRRQVALETRPEKVGKLEKAPSLTKTKDDSDIPTYKV